MKRPGWLRWTPRPAPPAIRNPRCLTAHFWDGGAAEGTEVREISLTGAYIVTTERWYPGTILDLTFQKNEHEDQRLPGQRQTGVTGNYITIPCLVWWQGTDGMELVFVFAQPQDRRAMESFMKSLTAQGSPNALQDHRGQSLIEFALMVPLLFLLILNAVNFGGFLYGWITVSNAARAGAQYSAMGAAYASYPAVPSLANITALIRNETASLPGASSSNPSITVCENQNGTAVTFPPTNPVTACSSTAPPQDLETITGLAGASTYTSVAIDITYTYTPLVGAFTFGTISLSPVPLTLHRRTVMRVLN